MFGLLGPNGSGKTTLFRLLSTLLGIQQGELTVCGLNVRTQQHRVRQRIGVTFQSPALDSRLTVRENFECHAALYGTSAESLTERIHELTVRLRISDRLNSVVSTLSGGLRRRVELAKGLLHSPDLLLLDEPTIGLDVRARQEFMELLREQRQQSGTTIVMATHLMQEAEHCDELLLLDRGTIVGAGSPEKLQADLKGERLVLQVDRMEDDLAGQIGRSLDAKAIIEGQQLTFHLNKPGERIADILKEFGDRIISIQISRPSLEDVFLTLTGRSLQCSEEDTAV